MWILIVFVVISISVVLFSLHYGISPMPSNSKAKNALLASIPPLEVGKILELGAGFGTLALPLAKKFPDREVWAYEISLVPYLVLLLRKKILKLKNLRVRRKNFHKISFNDAALCVCYLFPKGMERLKNKFDKELGPGSVIVSNTFGLHAWKPENVIEVGDLMRSKIFVYRHS